MRTAGGRERGDVLMEYVLLMALITAPVVCGAKMLFGPGGVRTEDGASAGHAIASVGMALEKEDDFGIVGNRLVEMFRRTFSGLALPVP